VKVLVDTSVWSLALRRVGKHKAAREEAAIQELLELIREMRVVLVGPIRQELLSGISDKRKYEELRSKLEAFEDMPLETGHYELAAALANECRQHGIQGSHVDFLICAAGRQDDLAIFTLDKDFERYRPHTGIRLHAVRDESK
jgi:predicted nucleic acid-binding protein